MKCGRLAARSPTSLRGTGALAGGAGQAEEKRRNLSYQLPATIIGHAERHGEEPVARRRYLDLIAILLDGSVLVIEVKDWRLAELGIVTPEAVTIPRRDAVSVVPHPRQQARGYMLRLMDECRRHPMARMLMQKEDRYAGGYAFPFCHIAVLSNINRSQIEREAPGLGRLFPPVRWSRRLY